MYIWYYDAALRFVDWEVSGIEVFSVEELEGELQNNPDKFTKDLHFMFDRYKYILKKVTDI